MSAVIPGTTVKADFFSEEVHTLARVKGWWDRPRSNQEVLVLIISELYEAVEEYRHDRISPSTSEEGKPEGVLVELADAVIRLLDLAGSTRAPVHLWDGMHRHHTEFFPDILGLTSYLSALPQAYPDRAIARIEKLASQWVGRAEFWSIVREKHEFNKGRGYRHGGKKA